jgi:hypothetical protein
MRPARFCAVLSDIGPSKEKDPQDFRRAIRPDSGRPCRALPDEWNRSSGIRFGTAGLSKTVGFPPPISERLIRSRRQSPHSAKTYGNLGHRTACRKTDEFPEPAAALIGGLMACPGNGLRLRKSADVTTKFVCRGGWSGRRIEPENLLMTDFFRLVAIVLSGRVNSLVNFAPLSRNGFSPFRFNAAS